MGGNMKKILLAIGLILVLSTNVLAVPNDWSYKPKTINKRVDTVYVTVDIYYDDEIYFGREITFVYKDIKDYSLVQFRNAITAQVEQIITQEEENFRIKEKLKPHMNTEIIIP